MNILDNAVRTVIKRPFIIIFFAALFLAYTIVNTYNPILPVIIGLANITGGSVFESVVSAIQMILAPGMISIVLLALPGLAVFGALAAGLLLSGYMNMLQSTVEGRKKTPGQFREGISKYFLKTALTTLKVILVYELLAVFLLVSCVPAAVITRAAFSDSAGLVPAAVFIDLLTVCILFFGLMFTRAYTFFWYPAIIKGESKPFICGKRFADGYFWGFAVRMLVFDAIFIIFQAIIYILGDPTFQFALTWIFNTCFFTCLTVYIFDTFNKLYVPGMPGELPRRAHKNP